MARPKKAGNETTKTVKATKAAEVKAEAAETTKAVAASKAAEAKTEAKAETEVKAATPKKAPAKKTAAKAELKVETVLQFAGKEVTEKDLLKQVKEVWTKELKNKVGDMKSVKIYVKPEETAAYYVVNDGEATGKIEL